MTQQINILLETDDSDNWTFSIVSSIQLAIKNTDKPLKTITTKAKKETDTEKCANCMQNVEIRVFCTETLNAETVPLEHVFVKEEPIVEEIKAECDDDTSTAIIKDFSMNSQTGKKFTCNICHKNFENREFYLEHIRLKVCQNPIKRENQSVLRCRRYLPKGLDLPDLTTLKGPLTAKFVQPNETIAYVHQNSESSFLWITNFDLLSGKCEICNWNCERFQYLVYHRYFIHFFPGYKSTCNGCGKFVSKVEDRRLHSLYCLKRKDIRPHYCYTCDIDFDSLKLYRKHLKENHDEKMETYHTPLKPVSRCMHCQYRCDSEENLSKHIRKNHSKKNTNSSDEDEVEIVSNKEPNKITVIESDDEMQMVRHIVTSRSHSEHSYSAPAAPIITNRANEIKLIKNLQQPSLASSASVTPGVSINLTNSSSPITTKWMNNSVRIYRTNIPKPSHVSPNELLTCDESAPTENGQKSNSIKIPLKIMQKPSIHQPISDKPPLKEVVLEKLTFSKFENLHHLPKGFILPNFRNVKPPFMVQKAQPDGTLAYVWQSSGSQEIYITNFNLVSRRCELCKEKFLEWKNLIIHRIEIHLFPGNKSECVGCGIECNSPSLKRYHSYYCLKKDTINLKYCYICDTEFDNYLNLCHHFNAKHADWKEGKFSKDRPYSCAHCPAIYHQKTLLKNHIIESHFKSLARYKCSDCTPPKCFNLKSHLDTHHNRSKRKRYDKRRPILRHKTQASTMTLKTPKVHTFVPCDTCGKLYKKENLRIHMKTHLPESERPFKCKHCGKGFNTPRHLAEHENYHTGERPFSCEYCGKGFNQKQTLRDHIRTHTGNGYKCGHCDRMLWDHSSYRKHLKRHEAQLGVKLTYNKEEARLKKNGLLEGS